MKTKPTRSKAKTATASPETNPLDMLFEDFATSAWETFQALERQYGIERVVEQVFHVKDLDIFDPDTFDAGKAHLRAKSWAWGTLVALYEYAVNGQCDEARHPGDLVMDGSDVLKLASSEMFWTCQEWDDIVATGDGRFSLDEGSDMDVRKLALLARVDIRTVRNAISAGELIAIKDSGGEPFIENASARRWLLGRRHFKPTVQTGPSQGIRLGDVSTPAQFGDFLKQGRARIAGDLPNGASVTHPAVGPDQLQEVEAGVFSLPLDCVFPLADFYRVDRKSFLECVMRVFFSDELRVLERKGE